MGLYCTDPAQHLITASWGLEWITWIDICLISVRRVCRILYDYSPVSCIYNCLESYGDAAGCVWCISPSGSLHGSPRFIIIYKRTGCLSSPYVYYTRGRDVSLPLTCTYLLSRDSDNIYSCLSTASSYGAPGHHPTLAVTARQSGSRSVPTVGVETLTYRHLNGRFLVPVYCNDQNGVRDHVHLLFVCTCT